MTGAEAAMMDIAKLRADMKRLCNAFETANRDAFDRAIAELAITQYTDRCAFCLGAKGGEPGNENVIGGVVCCDDCTTLVLSAIAGRKVTR